MLQQRSPTAPLPCHAARDVELLLTTVSSMLLFMFRLSDLHLSLSLVVLPKHELLFSNTVESRLRGRLDNLTSTLNQLTICLW